MKKTKKKDFQKDYVANLVERIGPAMPSTWEHGKVSINLSHLLSNADMKHPDLIAKAVHEIVHPGLQQFGLCGFLTVGDDKVLSGWLQFYPRQ